MRHFSPEILAMPLPCLRYGRALRRTAALICLAGCAHTPAAVDSARPAEDYGPREQTADQQVRHALNRLAFGPRPGDYERVRAMGVDRWIAQQLTPSRMADDATDRWLTQLPTLNMSSAELTRAYPSRGLILAQRRAEQRQAAPRPLPGDSTTRDQVMLTADDSQAVKRAGETARRVVTELQAARVARGVGSERQLQEVMVDFWENHFNIFAAKGADRYLLTAYDRDVIRPHVLGRFRDLVGAVARSPAMLFYLDNWESAVEPDRPALVMARRSRHGLNENYARELLELHTLGVDGGYTQHDVIDVARAFTGWTIDQPRKGGSFIFRPAMHDAGPKTVLGHQLSAGRGIEDGEAVLDLVAQQPATAHFIATKLVRHFVSDSAPPALVDRAAATFQRTGGDIRETMRTIVTSPEFFSAAAYRSKVKSPLELVVSALRAVGARPDSTPRTAGLVGRLGEPLYGHQAPNGYPDVAEAWINTGSILRRINFGLALASGRIAGATLASWSEGRALENASHEAQVDGVVRAILGGEASPDTRHVLESGVNPVLASAPAPDKSADVEPDGTMDGTAGRALSGETSSVGVPRPGSLDGLSTMVGLALGAPEFQRR